LGQPVVMDLRAYVPTYHGQVHEIELAEGKLLGRYNLGPDTRLRVGGARLEGTKRLYFPADEFCVYVLDVGVANKQEQPCEAILYTRHTSGSLRSAPSVVNVGNPETGGAPQGFLILSQAEGMNYCLLRAYALPIQNAWADPLQMNPEPRVRGWPWFPPYSDS